MVLETKYAKKDDVHIAYQVVGEGPLDLVLGSTWSVKDLVAGSGLVFANRGTHQLEGVPDGQLFAASG